MANERLQDLTPAEIAEIRAGDPRVVLMEKLYGDPDAKKDIQKHSKRIYPKASVPEIDIPEIVKGEIKEDVEAIKTLRKELEDDKKSRRHSAFRAKLQEAGAETEDLDDIEAFMVDNEIGPKSLPIAVEKFYQAKELAEPRGAGLSPDMPLGGDDAQMKALLAAGPNEDLDKINEPFAEKIWQEMFGSPARRR